MRASGARLPDRAVRSLTGHPVGWQLTGSLPDNQTGDGRDSLLGDYQDLRKVTGA